MKVFQYGRFTIYESHGRFKVCDNFNNFVAFADSYKEAVEEIHEKAKRDFFKL